ncbi:hypothetical protein ABIE26_001597 [Pedobacter africanus]|uniref:Uncharacterized protein n=1 Tax=Pedobacter africanus TaxID=151894 RepID=A0ACC6KRG8_9SPHI|nr:hypothetical protein [Pedobacter africanus]MDR6781914.1 hypothetical protein [Pedobacter africanus]
MKYNAIWLLVVISATFFFAGCMSENEKKNSFESNAVKSQAKRKDNLNISILLDLSDRIDPVKNTNPGMEFFKRDLGYIEAISRGFENHLRSKPIRQDNDHIQIYFEPEPLNPEINNLAQKLKLSFTKDNTTKEGILKISKQYGSASNEIYKLAIKDNKYIGSDIWGFFKNKVNDYCIKPDHRNILFILTDGYVFHRDSKFIEGPRSSYLTPEYIKSLKLNTSNYKEVMKENDYGFVKANDNLTALEVVVLGINPAKGNPFEGDVIGEYWVKWLQEMKVKSPVMKPIPADLPSNLEAVIQKYISGIK